MRVQLGDSIVIKRLPVAAVLISDLAYITQLMDSFSVLIHGGIERKPYRLITDAAQCPSSFSLSIGPSANKDAKLYHKR